jgi:uncharacterized membrane protein YdbT with pleckstrin-like domain
MSIHLMRDEQIVWSSFPGKRYRSYVFFRDLCFYLIAAVLLHECLNQLLPTIHTALIRNLPYGLAGLGIILAGINQLKFLLVRYYLTTDRIVISTGFFSRRLSSIKFVHISDIKINQTFSERLLKTGTIYIFTANDSNINEDDSNSLNRVAAFKNIDEPFDVHSKLEELMENREDTASIE